MVVSKSLGVVLFLSLFGTLPPAMGCTLTMGFKPDAKLPFIAAAPNNAGLYLDLYTRAAERLGCELAVVREPKRRIHEWMKEGRVDFYPGMKYSTERAQFALFIENGLPGGRAGLSMADLPEIRDRDGFDGVTVVAGLGGVDYLTGVAGVRVERVPDLSIDKAVGLLRRGRAQFYSTDIIAIEHYLRSRGIADMRVHRDCCGGVRPLHLGFSRESPHFQGEPNPAFDPANEPGPDNQPQVPAQGSLPQRMGDALNALRREGVTGQLLGSRALESPLEDGVEEVE